MFIVLHSDLSYIYSIYYIHPLNQLGVAIVGIPHACWILHGYGKSHGKSMDDCGAPYVGKPPGVN
jgi:hypothetical protein